MALAWEEIVERGQHRFECEHDGVHLEITKTPAVRDGWACRLPNGTRLIGELHTVKRLAEFLIDRTAF